jgi:hypothetical protein
VSGGFESARETGNEEPARAEPAALQAAPSVELVRSLSRSAGNRAVSALLQRHGTHAAVAGTAPPGADAKWEKVKADLSFSKYGWEALGILADKQITLQLRDSGAVAGYVPKTNTCFVNVSMPSYEVAAYFVHEMYHASQFHAGLSPGPKTKSENDWVTMMVAEEIDGTVKGFMHKLALERFGRAPEDDRPAGMGKFRGAYTYGYKQAIEAGKDPVTARQEGIARGRRMVDWMMKRPSKRTAPDLGPNKFDTYEEYYRREWQQTTRTP